MKHGQIVLGIIASIIVIILLYTVFTRTPFDPTISLSTSGNPVPSDTTPAPTDNAMLAETGVVSDAVPSDTQTLAHLTNDQLRSDNSTSLMMQNNTIRKRLMPDLFPAEDQVGAIAEDQASVEPTSTTVANYGPVQQQTSYNKDTSSIIGAGAINQIGSSIADIGKSITELPGEVNGNLGFAGYTVNTDYNLLPANLYNNMLDYKQQQQSSNLEYNPASAGGPSDMLDKLPRAIIQKDFQGVSNIFAPNFIFLGKRDDYNIGFDENMQYS